MEHHLDYAPVQHRQVRSGPRSSVQRWDHIMAWGSTSSKWGSVMLKSGIDLERVGNDSSYNVNALCQLELAVVVGRCIKTGS